MISIVDYGLGNVRAIANIYKRLNIPARLASTPEELAEAERIILPGVGSFDWAMRSLERAGLREALDGLVLEKKRPVLGICVGMQMMARSSEEGSEQGLGWIDAEVKKFAFEPDHHRLMLPHMGWNDISADRPSALLHGFDEGAQFYFLHSYYFAASNDDDIIMTADYDGRFTCGVQAGNCYGVQFHPEKSHHWGISLLKNFSEVQASEV